MNLRLRLASATAARRASASATAARRASASATAARRASASAAAVLVTALAGVVASAAAAAPTYPVGTAATGYPAELTAPNSSPPGVNVWRCRPSSAHPDPVVLLPGTFYNLAESFQALGPTLANDGYCVFGLSYGADALTALTGGRVSAVGEIRRAARQLAAFVTRVRTVTGAAQVDIVGWSQGGMMPRQYLKFGGGARYVHDLVGLACSSHGTTLDGLFALINADTLIGLPATTTLADCPACTEFQPVCGLALPVLGSL
jgi:triacylglycerol esterase/lipase EstA (alpha/beta hydrolase family)